jgi:transcriptional regulator with XRE-family HTH domain
MLATYETLSYSRRMAVEFGDLLRVLIERMPMTRVEFAEKTGIAASFVSNLIAGDRSPPPDRLELFADVLGLRGREREHFLDLAMLAHLPRDLHPRWIRLLGRLEAVERRLDPA